MKKNKLLLVPEYPYGGAEKQMFHLYNYIKKSDISDDKIKIIATNKSELIPEWNIDLLQSSKKNRLSKFTARLIAFAKLIIKIVNSRTNTIIIYNRIYLPLIPILKLFSIETVFSIREYDENIIKSWRKVALLQSKKVFSNSRRVSILLNEVGIHCDYIRNYHEFKEPDWKKENREIICISNVQPHKKIKELIKIIEGTKAKLIIFGKYDNQKYYQECREVSDTIKEEIIFEGFKEHSYIRHRLSRAAVLIHPSEKEGTANAILDAIDVGIPIIVNNIPENREILGNFTGYTDINDIKQSRDMLIKILECNEINYDRGIIVNKYGKENLKKLSKMVV